MNIGSWYFCPDTSKQMEQKVLVTRKRAGEAEKCIECQLSAAITFLVNHVGEYEYIKIIKY